MTKLDGGVILREPAVVLMWWSELFWEANEPQRRYIIDGCSAVMGDSAFWNRLNEYGVGGGSYRGSETLTRFGGGVTSLPETQICDALSRWFAANGVQPSQETIYVVMLPQGIISKYDTDGGFVGHHQTYQYKALAAPGSSLDGYVSVSPNQQHVNYLSADGHVHELVYDNGWTHHDLTNDAGGAPAAAPGSSLDGYVSVSPNQQHVNYLDANGHVHELVYDNGWTHHDLTNDAGGAPAAAPGSSLDGYVSVSPNQQHVNYVSADGHVHELVYDNGWMHHDLMDDSVDNSPTATVYYGVVDYSPDSRKIMSVLTHEVCEAATDPDVKTGYFDHAKGGETEIGDLCSTVTPMDTYPVQTIWSQRNCSCV